MRDYLDGDIWRDDRTEILCRTESAANAIANLIEQLYKSQNEEKQSILDIMTQMKIKNNEEDRYSGWWYVNI